MLGMDTILGAVKGWWNGGTGGAEKGWDIGGTIGKWAGVALGAIGGFMLGGGGILGAILAVVGAFVGGATGKVLGGGVSALIGGGLGAAGGTMWGAIKGLFGWDKDKPQQAQSQTSQQSSEQTFDFNSLSPAATPGGTQKAQGRS